METLRKISCSRTHGKQAASKGPFKLGKGGRRERKNGAVSIVISRLPVIKNLRFRATGETSIQIFYPYGLLPGLLLGYHPQYIQHIGLSREY